ncbi:MAG: transglutaminase family protein [Planctomycetia bacterium]
MRYKVIHRTRYSCHDPVSVGHNQAWLEFRQVDRQSVESFSLVISPEPSVRTRRIDAFGNPVHMFSFNEGYQHLDVTSAIVVKIDEVGISSAGSTRTQQELVDSLRYSSNPFCQNATEYRFRSPRIHWTPEIRAYAADSLSAFRPLLQNVVELTKRIHADFVYDNRATTVNTPVTDVFRLRRGVCQDFAHLQIAMLRSHGIPCRYVSGYLRTIPPIGQPRLVGADASHAWLSVYLGSGEWVDLDPTNNRICSQDHITLAWGRDYGDVPPLTGVFIGGGQHQLTVSVDVQPL